MLGGDIVGALVEHRGLEQSQRRIELVVRRTVGGEAVIDVGQLGAAKVEQPFGNAQIARVDRIAGVEVGDIGQRYLEFDQVPDLPPQCRRYADHAEDDVLTDIFERFFDVFDKDHKKNEGYRRRDHPARELGHHAQPDTQGEGDDVLHHGFVIPSQSP